MYDVLIVDDERVAHEYLSRLINWQKNGFNLLPPAYNTRDAKSRISTDKPHIVIFDISMPGENGVLLSSFIMYHYPQVHMLAISSHDDYDYVRQVLKNGAHDYILKHRLNEESLLAALHAICEHNEGGEKSGNATSRRMQLYKWLFNNADYPYMGLGGICAATIAVIPELKTMEADMNSSAAEGIISIIEKNYSGMGELTVIFKPPNLLINFYLFTKTVSESKMLSDIYLCTQKSRDNIKKMYKMEYQTGDYPLISNYKSLPAHLLNAIGNINNKTLNKNQTKPILLPLTVKRRFLSAMEERNCLFAQQLIELVFSDIAPLDSSHLLSVTNEFLDILLSTAAEAELHSNFSKTAELEAACNRPASETQQRLKEITSEIINEAQGICMPRSEYIIAAMKIIDKDYSKDLTQDEVAGTLGLSSSYLSRLFKQETGSSFTEALNRRRIEAAKFMLEEGKSIKEVALLCGYKRYNYFITVFKNYTGTTPAKYIKQENIYSR